MARRNTDWDDDRVDPIRGSNRPTEFFKSNFKLMGVGGIFRTPKAKFSPKTIHAEAKKAGFRVQTIEEGPWLKVTVTGKLPPKPLPAPKKQDSYIGAGKVYPSTNNTTTSDPAPDIFS
jgi:hypothetical protein